VDVRPGEGVLRLAFDTPVEERFLEVRAEARDGRAVSGAPRVDPGDPEVVLLPVAGGAASARVRWRVLSRDGHVTAGATTPGAGVPSTTAARVSAAAGRIAVVAGLVLVLGLVVLRAGVVGPAWAQGGIARPGRGDADAFRVRAAAALVPALPGWWRLWWAGAALAAAGAALTAVATLAGLRSAAVWDLVAHTRLGNALAVVLVAVALAALAARAVGRRAPEADPGMGAAPAALMGVPAAAGLVAVSWSGHAATGGDVALNVLLDAVHNGATAAWIGGLAGLVVLLDRAARRLDAADRVRLSAAAVVRFSALGVGAVATLAVTGVYRALAELGALGDLVSTGYGVALLVKLGLFALMLGVAGYNRLVLHVRLERAALGLDPGDRGASAALGRSVRAELVLAAALLVAVAVLVGTAPPRS